MLGKWVRGEMGGLWLRENKANLTPGFVWCQGGPAVQNKANAQVAWETLSGGGERS
jgi:hypothetical protein